MSNNPTGAGKGKKSYSKDVKIAALVVLRDNGYNYQATSKILKIAKESLKAWNKEYGADVAKENTLPVKIELAKIDIQTKKNEIINKSAEVLNRIIEKIDSRIQNENRIPVLVNAAMALNAIINNPSVVAVQNNQFNFIQGIHKQLKGKIDESSNS